MYGNDRIGFREDVFVLQVGAGDTQLYARGRRSASARPAWNLRHSGGSNWIRSSHSRSQKRSRSLGDTELLGVAPRSGVVLFIWNCLLVRSNLERFYRARAKRWRCSSARLSGPRCRKRLKWRSLECFCILKY